MKIKIFSAIILLLVVTGKTWGQQLDKEKLSGIKSLAFAYCWGVPDITIFNSTKIDVKKYGFDQQPFYDFLEKKVVEKMNAANIKLIPFSESQPVYSSMIKMVTALSEIQGKPAPTQEQINQLNNQMEQLQKLQQMVNMKMGGRGSGLVTGNSNAISSSNTSVALAPAIDKNGQEKPGAVIADYYSDEALKVYARMAKDMNVDAFMIIHVSVYFSSETEDGTTLGGFSNMFHKEPPHAIVKLDFRIYDAEEKPIVLFKNKDAIRGYSKEALASFKSSFGHFEWNNGEAEKIEYDAMEQAVNNIAAKIDKGSF